MITKRRLPIDTEQIEDMKLIIFWKLRHQMGFVFEIDTSLVLPLLPYGIYPVEARPGISMAFISYNDYAPGLNSIDGKEQPRFYEMTRCIIVQPDLSVRMPVPRFTFFVHRIGSNNASFVEQEISWLHLPSYHSSSISPDVDETGQTLVLRDEHGPIQHLKNTHPSPVYRNESFFGQYYTVEDGKLYFGAWSWRGVACVHQRGGDAGGILEHPFLTELERRMPAKSLQTSYQQFFTRPGEISEHRFYQPRLVRNLKESK